MDNMENPNVEAQENPNADVVEAKEVYTAVDLARLMAQISSNDPDKPTFTAKQCASAINYLKEAIYEVTRRGSKVNILGLLSTSFSYVPNRTYRNFLSKDSSSIAVGEKIRVSLKPGKALKDSASQLIDNAEFREALKDKYERSLNKFNNQ